MREVEVPLDCMGGLLLGARLRLEDMLCFVREEICTRSNCRDTAIKQGAGAAAKKHQNLTC